MSTGYVVRIRMIERLMDNDWFRLTRRTYVDQHICGQVRVHIHKDA